MPDEHLTADEMAVFNHITFTCNIHTTPLTDEQRKGMESLQERGYLTQQNQWGDILPTELGWKESRWSLGLD